MRIAMTGASGMIGTELRARLAAADDEVVPLVRKRPAATDSGALYWNPATGEIDAQDLAGIDAVVHLAGENVGAGRWNTARKKRIFESRVAGTELLSRALATARPAPKVFVAASAIGLYGDRGDETLSEASGPGRGYLSDLCTQWEAATAAASDAGIRTVNLRIGVVLSTRGGALSRMLPPFRLGLGGVVGGGSQYVSWITLVDVCRAIQHCLASERMSGAVNAVAPHPATNREMTKALGATLRRPTIFPLPAFAVATLLGEMGRELLLASTRVVPSRLLADGFLFEHGRIEGALAAVVGRD